MHSVGDCSDSRSAKAGAGTSLAAYLRGYRVVLHAVVSAPVPPAAGWAEPCAAVLLLPGV